MDVTADGSENYVIGVDYGTLSGRAVVVRVRDGKELGSGVFDYPHAVVTAALPADVADTAEGTAARLPGEWALQVPNDYRDVLRHAVPAAIADAGIDAAAVVGIATDFTACTMVPVKADGTPLNEVPGFANRPHAYVKLWRHHAAQGQADRINALAAELGESWLPRYGGLISSEWEFAKGLQLLEEDPEAYAEWTTGWRPPTGSSGSSAETMSATPAPPATRASTRTGTTRPMTSSPP
jgi:L-ribulokinase